MENSIDHIYHKDIKWQQLLGRFSFAERMAERRRKEQKRISVAKELLGCGSLVQPFLNA